MHIFKMTQISSMMLQEQYIRPPWRFYLLLMHCPHLLEIPKEFHIFGDSYELHVPSDPLVLSIIY